jgi:major membrane immunogen (membrane-anchored lipoprotein)
MQIIKVNMLLLLGALLLAGCGSSGGGDNTPATGSNNWDEMKWDEGKWS